MGTAVYAQGHGMMDEHALWEKLMNLGLDEKQKEAVKEISRKTMKETIQKRADLEIVEIDLKDLLDEDTVNMKAVESKLNQIASIRTEIHLARIRAYEAIKLQLTSDQRKKLREILAQEMMTGKMGMMQGRGCGMMGEMMGGKMHHGIMGTATPSGEKSGKMPEIQHGSH